MRFSYIRRFKTSLIDLKTNFNFVPEHEPVVQRDIKILEEFLLSKPNILVLTGAGISTESGIPDYRSEGVGLYARTNHRPIQHMEFVKFPDIRKRYWARNYVGWPRFSSIEPNATHNSLAKFEREGRIKGIVTQNVDKLHTKAGSKNVIELHGSGYTVICLTCDYKIDRHEFQSILSTLNSDLVNNISLNIRPDGDVDIPQEYIDNFKLPLCPKCNKDHLKPNIVFFGDNVPKNRIEKITKMIIDSDGLLVLGSSLVVFSGYRLLLQAKELNLPIAIVNIGLTRGDQLADIKISAKCGGVIPKLFNFS